MIPSMEVTGVIDQVEQIQGYAELDDEEAQEHIEAIKKEVSELAKKYNENGE